MNKQEIKPNEKILINSIIKTNKDLLKNYVFDEKSLKNDLILYCRNYLRKNSFKIEVLK